MARADMCAWVLVCVYARACDYVSVITHALYFFRALDVFFQHRLKRLLGREPVTQMTSTRSTSVNEPTALSEC